MKFMRRLFGIVNRTDLCGQASLVALLLGSLLIIGCGKEEDALAPSLAISGTVKNNSGQTGTIIVEIDHNLRAAADANGRYAIAVHADYFVDSLYAWVDRDGSGSYTSGEPLGFYHSSAEPNRAKSFHVRSSNVTGIDFSIP